MKKLKVKLLFGVAVAMLLSGGAVLTYLQAQPVVSGSDLVAANIEAMADGEVEAGYVSSVSEITTQGDPYTAGGKTCRTQTFEKTCHGNGTIWCQHYSNVSNNCW